MSFEKRRRQRSEVGMGPRDMDAGEGTLQTT